MGKKRYIYRYLESWAFLGIEFSNLISYLLGEEPVLPLLFVPQHTGFPLPIINTCHFLHFLSIFYFWDSPQPWIITHFLSSYKFKSIPSIIHLRVLLHQYVQTHAPWFSLTSPKPIDLINSLLEIFTSNKLWNISTI